MHRIKRYTILVGWLTVLLQAPATFAQVAAIAPQADDEIEAPPATDDARFNDPQRLFETFAGDALDGLAMAQEAAAAAETARDAAARSGTASPQEIAALEGQLRQAADAQTAYEAEIASVADLVVRLSADQVFDLNRELDYALASGMPLDLDAALLQRVIDGDYDHRQIKALVQELEQEARLLARGNPF